MAKLTKVYPNERFNWRLLWIYSLYRILIVVIIRLVFEPGTQGELGTLQTPVYQYTLIGYASLAVIFLLASLFLRRNFRTQAGIQCTVDIIAIGLLTFAVGGVQSGLGILLAVSASSAIIFLRHQSSLVYGIAACLVVIYGQYIFSTLDNKATDFTPMGFLVAAILAMSVLSMVLTRRLSHSETREVESSRNIANLEKINSLIIDKMERGVVVVDRGGVVQLINHTAWYQLGLPDIGESSLLLSISKDLHREFGRWSGDASYDPLPFKISRTGPEFLPSFVNLGDYEALVMIFLEDQSQLRTQAQNLKLASLGQLTASIAHEIRNPLGAISHASQLLEESQSIAGSDRPMLEIIGRQSKRINNIIESVMAMSQRGQSHQTTITVSRFLADFHAEFMINKPKSAALNIVVEPGDMQVIFDSDQLTQVITNLADNGLRHSDDLSVQIHAGIDEISDNPFLDVIDNGAGVAADMVEKIFEPFYTSRNEGTGLGLYLSREICEANGARLDYVPLNVGGACFRISFARMVPPAVIEQQS